MQMVDLYKLAETHLENGCDVVIVTVVDKRGEGPMPIGGRMLLAFQDATLVEKWGTIGGGALEGKAIETAHAHPHWPGSTQLLAYDLIGGPGGPGGLSGPSTNVYISVPMICGGLVTLFYERLKPQPRLLVYGGGNVGSALCHKMEGTGFSVFLSDPALTQGGASSTPWTLISDQAALKLVNRHTYIVIATGSHDEDAKILSKILQCNLAPAYIGMLASKKKVAQIKGLLEQEGLGPWPELYSPIGLDIGAQSPDEIAISIAAQLIAKYYGVLETVDMHGRAT